MQPDNHTDKRKSPRTEPVFEVNLSYGPPFKDGLLKDISPTGVAIVYDSKQLPENELMTKGSLVTLQVKGNYWLKGHLVRKFDNGFALEFPSYDRKPRLN